MRVGASTGPSPAAISLFVWPGSRPNGWLPQPDGTRHRNSEREYLAKLSQARRKLNSIFSNHLKDQSSIYSVDFCRLHANGRFATGLRSRGSRKAPASLPDVTRPIPGGWNRIQLPVSDLAGEVTRLRQLGVTLRREDFVEGYGGSQAWLLDPSGNLVELFQAKH
jgi:catechol 2,3-dioxygenase-like lactoylglutathione lyase family enzyme